MMKRFIAILLVLLLIFAGCKATQKPNSEGSAEGVAPKIELDSAAVAAVTNEWEKIVAVTDVRGQIELWALGYIQEFCADPTVPNLQRALSASAAALDDLRLIETQECTLTSDTLAALAEDGVDMSFVPMHFGNLKTDMETDIETWESIVSSMLTDSFWEYGVEYLSDWSAVRKATVELNCLYIAKMSNALMLSLGESEDNPTYKEWIQKAPTVFSAEYGWNPDNNALADEISGVLDMTEENIVESSAVTGVLSANYAMFSDAYATGDWSDVYSVAIDYEEYFMPIPLPDWGAENNTMAIYSYYYDDTTEKSEIITACDDLASAPDGFVAVYREITADQFYAYASLLASLGFKYSEDSTLSEDYIELKYYNYCQITLEWSENLVYLYLPEADTLLVPSWYILYMLQ